MQIITPDNGKLSVIAKGVRREKSKLAGGIELLAISDLSLHKGKGELLLVTSARLDTFFSQILKDYERLQFAQYMLRDVRSAANSLPEPEFYEITATSLRALNDISIPVEAVSVWYRLQMAILLGVGLNLATDASGEKLVEGEMYRFDVGEMSFIADPKGTISADHIKLLRVASAHDPIIMSHIKNIQDILDEVHRLAIIAHE